MLRIQAMYFDSIRCYASLTQVTVFVTINTGVFLGKVCWDHRKNHGCAQKKTEGTSSAIFEIGTAAKYCELKRCPNPVRSTKPTTKIKSLKVT